MECMTFRVVVGSRILSLSYYILLLVHREEDVPLCQQRFYYMYIYASLVFRIDLAMLNWSVGGL